MAHLRPKYQVVKIKTGKELPASTDPEKVDAPFVLIPGKDPAAFRAMLAYAENCEEELAYEIYAWLRGIAETSPQLGTQGHRNLWGQLGREVPGVVNE